MRGFRSASGVFADYTRQQLDFHIGVGLTRSAPDHYIGVGYSFRIDSLFGGAARAQTQYRSAHQIVRSGEVSRTE